MNICLGKMVIPSMLIKNAERYIVDEYMPRQNCDTNYVIGELGPMW